MQLSAEPGAIFTFQLEHPSVLQNDVCTVGGQKYSSQSHQCISRNFVKFTVAK